MALDLPRGFLHCYCATIAFFLAEPLCYKRYKRILSSLLAEKTLPFGVVRKASSAFSDLSAGADNARLRSRASAQSEAHARTPAVP